MFFWVFFSDCIRHVWLISVKLLAYINLEFLLLSLSQSLLHLYSDCLSASSLGLVLESLFTRLWWQEPSIFCSLAWRGSSELLGSVLLNRVFLWSVQVYCSCLERVNWKYLWASLSHLWALIYNSVFLSNLLELYKFNVWLGVNAFPPVPRLLLTEFRLPDSGLSLCKWQTLLSCNCCLVYIFCF